MRIMMTLLVAFGLFAAWAGMVCVVVLAIIHYEALLLAAAAVPFLALGWKIAGNLLAPATSHSEE